MLFFFWLGDEKMSNELQENINLRNISEKSKRVPNISRATFTQKGCPIWICLSSSCRSCARCGSRYCSSGGPLWAMMLHRRLTGRSRRWRTCRRTASSVDSSVFAERFGPARGDTKIWSQLWENNISITSECCCCCWMGICSQNVWFVFSKYTRHEHTINS